MDIKVLDSEGKEVKTEKSFREKVKEFLTDAMAKAKELFSKLLDWISDHKLEALAFATFIGGLIKKSVKSSAVRHAEKERKRVDETYYDPSTGIHWQLRRKPTNREREIFAARKRNGEPAEVILSELGLLK